MSHYLSKYQTFSTTQELNHTVYTHIKRNSPYLNKTVRNTLKVIARYAVKYSGAAHLKAKTIAELIGKSEKTARRSVNKLAELGIIKKIATTRKVNGGKGANIIVIQPINNERENVNDQSTLSSREERPNSITSSVTPSEIEEEPSYYIKHNKNTLLDTETDISARAMRGAIPESVYDAFSSYFNADEIYKHYGTLLRAKRTVDKELLIEHCDEPFLDTIHAVAYKLKHGKVRNISNYFYRAFQSASSQASRILTSNKRSNSILSYDWIS